MKAFVDTNVYIDLIGNREQFVQDARKLCVAASFGDVELWVSTQTLTDADYILRSPDNREDVRRKMAASLEMFNVCGVHAADARDALSSGWPDAEDYIIAASARRLHADVILTRDVRGFQKSSVKALTPADLLSSLHEGLGIEYEEIAW